MSKNKIILAIFLICFSTARAEANSETIIRMAIEIDYPGAVIQDNACMDHPKRNKWKLCYIAFTHKGTFYIAQVDVDCGYPESRCSSGEFIDVISKKDL